MIKKTASRSLFADSPEDIEAERWKAAQKTKQHAGQHIGQQIITSEQKTSGIKKEPRQKSKIEEPKPVEVTELGFLKKKRGRKTSEQIKIFVRDNPSNCEELMVCMKNFGITTKQKYCYWKDLYFICVPDTLSKLLNIDLNAILRNAEIGLHFVQMENEEIYASKYGLVQLIAASKEPIALKFQDYIFELIQKIEEKGEVKIQDLETRQALVNEIEKTSLVGSYDLLHIQQQLQETEKAYHARDTDYNIVMDELQVKSRLLEKAEEEIKELGRQNYELRDIAEKLGKYVKLTKTADTSLEKLYHKVESYDISLESDDPNDIKDVHEDARVAKRRLKTTKKVAETTSTDNPAQTWSLIRSLYPTGDPTEYTWRLLQNVKDSFKEVSQKVLLELDEYPNCPPNLMATSYGIMLREILNTDSVWYDDVSLSDREVKFLNGIFTAKQHLTEDFIRGLFL